MTKEIAQELHNYVETIKNRYSIKDREGNFTQETFKLKEK